jgi:hypothetical protein
MYNTHTSLTITSRAKQNVRGSLQGGLKVATAFGIVGVFGIPLITSQFNVHTGDAVAFLAVPLSWIYLIWRILRMYLSPADSVAMDTLPKLTLKWAMIPLAVSVALGFPVLVVALASAFCYALLGLHWAVGPTIGFSKWVFFTMGGTALPVAMVAVYTVWGGPVTRVIILLLSIPRLPRRVQI